MGILSQFSLRAIVRPPLEWITWSEGELERVDLGNGRTLDAEDVMDGHFQRVSQEQTTSSTAAAEQVNHLDEAIEQIAPHLSPLTTIAKDVADSVSPVQPQEHFRSMLQQALEDAHQQQNAQRILGIEPPAHRPLWQLSVRKLIVVALFLSIVTVALSYRYQTAE